MTSPLRRQKRRYPGPLLVSQFMASFHPTPSTMPLNRWTTFRLVLKTPPSRVVFVGNSNNDHHVKAVAKCFTILVNPHFSTFTPEYGDEQIKEMKDLQELYPHVGIRNDPAFLAIARKQALADSALSILRKCTRIRLEEFTVVGGYRRFNPGTRELLTIWWIGCGGRSTARRELGRTI